jgi:hypothetical protein
MPVDTNTFHRSVTSVENLETPEEELVARLPKYGLPA